MSDTRYTFWKLIQENEVQIPQVQRDYVYGRTIGSGKEAAVLEGLLNEFKRVLESPERETIVLDFVYGDIHKKDNKYEYLIPLDGQQRLTTLYLLHVYAAVKQSIKNAEETGEQRKLPKGAEKLARFSYETRTSASTLCDNLVNHFIVGLKLEEPISEQIEGDPRYLPSYEFDPTIRSILNVLDKIQEIFKDTNDIWSKLTHEDERIGFDYLPMNDYKLSDELYIKMNSRGKFLTKYELFKSDLLGYIQEMFGIEERRKFSIWTDVNLTNIAWRLKKDNDIDDYLLDFYQNIFNYLYYRNKEGKIAKKAYFTNVLENEDDWTLFKAILNTIEESSNKGLFDNEWDSFFYLDNNVTGREGLIRLFTDREKDHVFKRAFAKGKLMNAEYLYLHALLLLNQNKFDQEKAFNKLRIVRNVVVNSNFYMREENLHTMLCVLTDFLNDVNFITTGTGSKVVFQELQVNEEIEKQKLTPKDYDNLLKYENHLFLKASVGLFLENGKLDTLPKFSSLFSDRSDERTHALNCALLLDETEYMQYTSAMEPSENYPTHRKRLFAINADYWNSFFARNSDRHNQGAILEIIAKETFPDSPDKLKKYIDNGLKSIDTQSWKYYIIKYPLHSLVNWTQGFVHWDDKENKPLEAVIMRSSTHPIGDNDFYNEWLLLNRVLYYEKLGGDEGRQYGLSKYCSPIVLPKGNASITSIQEGWKISSNTDKYDLLEELNRMGYNLIEDTWILSAGDDYIEKGEQLVKDIELIAENNRIDNIKDNLESDVEVIDE